MVTTELDTSCYNKSIGLVTISVLAVTINQWVRLPSVSDFDHYVYLPPRKAQCHQCYFPACSFSLTLCQHAASICYLYTYLGQHYTKLTYALNPQRVPE